jgi:hypothetical protein
VWGVSRIAELLMALVIVKEGRLLAPCAILVQAARGHEDGTGQRDHARFRHLLEPLELFHWFL